MKESRLLAIPLKLSSGGVTNSLLDSKEKSHLKTTNPAILSRTVATLLMTFFLMWFVSFVCVKLVTKYKLPWVFFCAKVSQNRIKIAFKFCIFRIKSVVMSRKTFRYSPSRYCHIWQEMSFPQDLALYAKVLTFCPSSLRKIPETQWPFN